MSVRICTLMWGNAWEEYGQFFAHTFSIHCSNNIEIYNVVDKKIFEKINFQRAENIVLEDVTEYLKILKKHNPTYPSSPPDKFWKFDWKKWLPQALTPNAVLEYNKHWVDGDIFVWLDADTLAVNSINEEWIQNILKDGDVAALFRKPKHTEIGFYAMRLNKSTRKVLKTFSDYYINGEVFDFDEWHSAYVWDKALESVENLKLINLNPTNEKRPGDHVYPYTILAERLIHNKGDLKKTVSWK